MTQRKIQLMKIAAKTYLVASISSVILTCFYCVQLTPVFLKLFVPFPALEEATVITGTVDVIGEWSFKAPARYFVANESGRHQVYCGLPTERLSCFGFGEPVQGATGTVWFHSVFGVLQWDITLHAPRAEGRSDKGTYAVQKKFFENMFSYKDYRFKGSLVLLGLGFALYQFIKFKSLRALERKQLQGE